MNRVKFRAKWIILSIIAIFLYTGLSIYMAFSLKDILDIVESKNLTIFRQTVIKSLVIIFLMAFAYFLKAFISRRFTAYELKETSKIIYSKLLKSGEVINSGETISLLTNDLNLAITSKVNMLFSLIENGLLLAFALISLFYVDVKVAFMVLCLSFLLTLSPKVFSKGLSKRRQKQVEKIGDMNNQLSNTLNGFETIKSFSAEGFMMRATFPFIQRAEKYLFFYNLYSQIANNTLFGLTFISQILVIIYTAVLILKGYLTLGAILLIGQLMNFVQEPISTLLSSKNELNANSEVFKKLEDIKNSERKYGTTDKNHLEESITLENIVFSYGNHEVFSNLNLKFEKGKKYAILGKSGVGKSTLFKLITGDLIPTRGEVLVDDIRVSDLNKNSINKIFQKVSQNLFTFAKSIKYNVCLYDEYSDEEYENALKNAQIYNKIDSLPNKSETMFEEAKVSLSGGERQRIQIARALLRDRDVFLFDEITSNLDKEKAISIEETINRLDKTVISIRHKLDESLKIYDEIIILESGSAKKILYEELVGM
ncbi:ABC transporter ATP-binding protein [Lagierella sp.]|uniref:ABC transporter ATP-binding protein n=1 Tax=Lagierella sp. TaxID=2849657 RepID=UPI0026102A96|nr:ABC transporter ATP-binding protein [Lagierella sp.]